MKYEGRFEELKQNLSVDTTLFVLHALPSPTSNKSIRILVEVPNTRHEAQECEDEEIANLSAQMVAVEPASEPTFKVIGRISGSTAADWIRVHQDKNGTFSYTATLASLIENGSYRDRKFLAERTRIASVVTLSYLLGVDWHKWNIDEESKLYEIATPDN